MTQLRTWITTLMAALLAAALAHGCSIGGDEPWEADDDDTSGGDTDADTDSDGDSDSDSEGMDLSASDTCDETQEVDVPGDYAGDTNQATNLYAGSCAEELALSGPDLVMTFHLDEAATFVAEITSAEFAVPVLYLRDECAVDTAELACELSEVGPPTLSAELDAGDYYLFVDGNSSQDAGEFAISLTLE